MITPDQVNEWRVIPRLALMMYGLVCYKVATWFMALPSPTVEQSAFATLIWGAAALWFNFYVTSGNKK